MFFAKSKRFIAFLLITNFLLVLLYLLVCLVPYLNPGDFWFIAILGLGFPLLFILVFLLGLIWLLLKSKWALLSFCAILLSWQQLSVALAVNFKSKSSIDSKQGELRILSWNVSRWDERNKEKRGGQSYRNMMMDFIETQGADVLCLQEFFECHDPSYYAANIPALIKLGFTYNYFFPTTELFEGKFQYGLAIFSRFPIVEAKGFKELVKLHSEGICYADININGNILRVFNSHFESPGFNQDDFSGAGSLKANNTVFSKLKKSYQIRSEQSLFATSLIRNSPFHTVVCSDLGDVPNSFSYFTLKGPLKDAFLKAGKGLGRTFRFISPSLRIDYIFVDKKLNIGNYYKSPITYSDHYPIIADITLNK